MPVHIAHHARLAAAALALLGAAAFAPAPAEAGNGATRSPWPTAANPGVPYYARIEFTENMVPTDGTWAAIVFYRDPACVPAHFNLLQMFDFPQPPASPGAPPSPGAFACGLKVHGFDVWEGAPFKSPAPKLVKSTGSAVPVWFVKWSELKGYVKNRVLTRDTLEDVTLLPSLRKGTAHFFEETLRPTQPDSPVFLHLHAVGTFDADGREFSLRYRVDGRRENTTIRFEK
jgi:hypothetical protein